MFLPFLKVLINSDFRNLASFVKGFIVSLNPSLNIFASLENFPGFLRVLINSDFRNLASFAKGAIVSLKPSLNIFASVLIGSIDFTNSL